MTITLHLSDLNAGAAVPPGETALVWVPTERVACHGLDVPPVPRKKWQAMIPWLLEERLLERVEGMDFVCGDARKNGSEGSSRVPVIAVSKTVVSGWRRELVDRNIRYSALVPDFFALPWQAGELAIAISANTITGTESSGNRCLVRTGPWQGAAGPAELILPLVENLVATEHPVLNLYAESADGLPETLKSQAVLHNPGELFSTPRQPWLAIATSEAPVHNGSWPLPARVAAGLAILGLGLFAGSYALETRRIEAEALHFESELRRGYQQYFGTGYDFAMEDFQRVVSARLGSGPDPALGLMSRLAAVIAGCGDCRVERLSGENGGIKALVSGAGAQQHLRAVAGGDVSMEAQGEQWLLSLGGQDHE